MDPQSRRSNPGTILDHSAKSPLWLGIREKVSQMQVPSCDGSRLRVTTPDKALSTIAAFPLCHSHDPLWHFGAA